MSECFESVLFYFSWNVPSNSCDVIDLDICIVFYPWENDGRESPSYLLNIKRFQGSDID